MQTFCSAEEFLELPYLELRGCLIADVHLGRMSGLELLGILARTPGAIPVILISGFDGGVTETEAIRLGAFAYFRKPFDATELLACAKRALGCATSVLPDPSADAPLAPS